MPYKEREKILDTIDKIFKAMNSYSISTVEYYNLLREYNFHIAILQQMSDAQHQR